MQKMTEAREALTAARRRYRADMKWLRREFGIVPEIEAGSAKTVLLAALDALEKGDAAALRDATGKFIAMHDEVMRSVVWDLLERTKRGIKSLPSSDPARRRKIEQWNWAGWKKHPWVQPDVFSGYRESIRRLAQI